MIETGCRRVQQPGDHVRHDRWPGRYEARDHGYCEMSLDRQSRETSLDSKQGVCFYALGGV